MSEQRPCLCDECEGGCTNLGLLTVDGYPMCEACCLDLHERDRRDAEE